MSINKGGQSLKPYVGGKEVKEAYVGSQLVYRSTPPYVYAFLGGQDDYVLADWCTLSGAGAAIVKEGNNFRIALSSYEAGRLFRTGSISMTKPTNAGNTLSFMVKKSTSYGTEMVIYKYLSSGAQTIIRTFTPTTNWQLVSVDVSNVGDATIIITAEATNYFDKVYFDAIRFEG